jgi:hypothetical protein
MSDKITAEETMKDLFGDEEEILSVQRDPNCGILTFHNGTEEAMLRHVEQFAISGDVDSILKAIDDFCFHRHWISCLFCDYVKAPPKCGVSCGAFVLEETASALNGGESVSAGF